MILTGVPGNPGIPAIPRRPCSPCIHYDTSCEEHRRFVWADCVYYVEYVWLTFIPGFPGKPSSPFLTSPPWEDRQFQHIQDKKDYNKHITNVCLRYTHTTDGPGCPGFPSGPCGETPKDDQLVKLLINNNFQHFDSKQVSSWTKRFLVSVILWLDTHSRSR